MTGLIPYLYSGKEVDRINGLNEYDFSARWQNNSVAGFTTLDPLAEQHPDDSPYLYCGNNPVNRVDPTGMEWYTKAGSPNEYQFIKGQSGSSYTSGGVTYNLFGETVSVYVGDDGQFTHFKLGDQDGVIWDKYSPDIQNAGTVAINLSLVKLYAYSGDIGGNSNNYAPDRSTSASFAVNATSTFVGILGQGWQSSSNASQWSSAYQITKTLEDTGIKVSTSAVKDGIPKIATGIGLGLAAASAVITLIDGLTNEKGWQGHHTADLVVNGALTGLTTVCPVAGAVVGGVYFVSDIATQYYTGKSITQNLFDK